MSKNNGPHIVELLAELGHQYRHFQQEHEREGTRSATRHTLDIKMQRLAERFMRLLSRWVQDEELRVAWNVYFYEGGSSPSEPKIASPPAFKGIAESGSSIEVRASDDGGYDVVVDGTVESHEDFPWHLDSHVIEPIQIGQHVCRETGEASPEALRALAAFLVTPEAEPPWRWLRTLFEDGLVDVNFSLTSRGRRRLGKFEDEDKGGKLHSRGSALRTA
jgi:hypothetical protein